MALWGFKGISITDWLGALGSGLVQWIGEAVVGLMPWLAYSLTHDFPRTKVYLTALCNTDVLENQFTVFSKYCRELPDSVIPEICILAVVISGLSVLSFGPGRRKSRTPFALLMMIFALVSFFVGGVFYALVTSHLVEIEPRWAYAALFVALGSSFLLSMQEAVLHARRELTTRAAPGRGD